MYEVADDDGNRMCLKLHRLGRTSFRAVKSKRDYLRQGSHYSWLYLSRLSAVKEFAFMRALGARGLPVPEAIDQNRHAVLMSLVDAFPLVQVGQRRHARRAVAEGRCSRAGTGLGRCCCGGAGAGHRRRFSRGCTQPSPVPRALDTGACSRGQAAHAPLPPDPSTHCPAQIKELASPARIYTQLIDLMERLAQMGLVHCDFNEFNILVRERWTLAGEWCGGAAWEGVE